MVVEVGLCTERVHFAISFLLLNTFEISHEKCSEKVENKY